MHNSSKSFILSANDTNLDVCLLFHLTKGSSNIFRFFKDLSNYKKLNNFDSMNKIGN